MVEMEMDYKLGPCWEKDLDVVGFRQEHEELVDQFLDLVWSPLDCFG